MDSLSLSNKVPILCTGDDASVGVSAMLMEMNEIDAVRGDDG